LKDHTIHKIFFLSDIILLLAQWFHQMMTFVTLLESTKFHSCLAVILEKQVFVNNKTNKS